MPFLLTVDAVLMDIYKKPVDVFGKVFTFHRKGFYISVTLRERSKRQHETNPEIFSLQK